MISHRSHKEKNAALKRYRQQQMLREKVDTGEIGWDKARHCFYDYRLDCRVVEPYATILTEMYPQA